MSNLQARAASAYATVSLESQAGAAGGVELVILLIEGAIDRIKRAKIAIRQRDINQKITQMNIALKIISEGLRGHLDVRGGGEIAQNLDDLYAYCSVRLLHANSKNDVDILDEIVRLLSPLLEAWNAVRSSSQPEALAGKTLMDVTRVLKSAVPSVQRLYGANAYGSHSEMGA